MSETFYNLYEAKSALSRLVDRAAAGDEIIIAKAGKPMAKLVPFVAGDSFAKFLQGLDVINLREVLRTHDGTVLQNAVDQLMKIAPMMMTDPSRVADAVPSILRPLGDVEGRDAELDAMVASMVDTAASTWTPETLRSFLSQLLQRLQLTLKRV